MRRFNLVLVKMIKTEGVIGGMIGGRDTLVFFDVGGGFQVI